MAHMIDETTGRAAIAYRGDVPWHGLGGFIEPSDDLDAIAAKAGLQHTVNEAKVLFIHGQGTGIINSLKSVPDRKVLYRSDTLAPLSVVSKDYQVVQPREVLAFFDEMVKSAGFSIETAGALSGGKRVWALARVGDGANVIGEDRVRPYLMMATSYDASMATTAKWVHERVVCHNTITAALGENGYQAKVYHSQKFDAAALRRDMGVALNAFEEWLIKAKQLASRQLSEDEISGLTAGLLLRYSKAEDVTKTRGYQSVMSLFRGAAIGSGMTQGGTAWQWLNAVTEHVDWSAGRTPDTRMTSAWFGQGEKVKLDAQTMALSLVA